MGVLNMQNDIPQNEQDYGSYERFRRIPKCYFYHLHWNKGLSTADIAEKYEITDRYVRRWFNKHGIQFARQYSEESHDPQKRFIFERRARSHYYKLYWQDDCNYNEIAELKDISKNTVGRVFRQANIVTIPEGRSRDNKWFDKERGIPTQFKMPRDEERKDGSSASNPKGELPENPDTEKYLAETPLHRDKERLYELHWKYGCSMGHIEAMNDSSRDIRRCFSELGIPYRDYASHKHWEPHHQDVPPMFEWPYDRDYDNENEMEWKLSDENMVAD